MPIKLERFDEWRKPMDEPKVLKRRIFLKGQALKLIRVERKEMKRRLALLDIREFFLNQMNQEFDPVLSQKIDCVDFLLRR